MYVSMIAVSNSTRLVFEVVVALIEFEVEIEVEEGGTDLVEPGVNQIGALMGCAIPVKPHSYVAVHD